MTNWIHMSFKERVLYLFKIEGWTITDLVRTYRTTPEKINSIIRKGLKKQGDK